MIKNLETKIKHLEEIGRTKNYQEVINRLHLETYEKLQELDVMVQRQIETIEISSTLKQFSKGAVRFVENFFDGNNPVPFTQYKPDLRGWSLDANQIIDQHAILFDNMSTKVVESNTLPDGMKVASRLLSSAIARDSLNKAPPTEKLALGIQSMNQQLWNNN